MSVADFNLKIGDEGWAVDKASVMIGAWSPPRGAR
jgi:molybdopterin-binding protein